MRTIYRVGMIAIGLSLGAVEPAGALVVFEFISSRGNDSDEIISAGDPFDSTIFESAKLFIDEEAIVPNGMLTFAEIFEIEVSGRIGLRGSEPNNIYSFQKNDANGSKSDFPRDDWFIKFNEDGTKIEEFRTTPDSSQTIPGVSVLGWDFGNYLTETRNGQSDPRFLAEMTISAVDNGNPFNGSISMRFQNPRDTPILEEVTNDVVTRHLTGGQWILTGTVAEEPDPTIISNENVSPCINAQGASGCVEGAGNVSVTGSVVVGAASGDGQLTVDLNTLTIDGPLVVGGDNRGQVDIGSGGSVIASGVQILNNGDVNLSDGTLSAATGVSVDGTLTSTGQEVLNPVNIVDTPVLDIGIGGKLAIDGPQTTITGDVVNSGFIDMLLSPEFDGASNLDIQGNLTLGGDVSTLAFGVRGTDIANDFISVSGTADLNGLIGAVAANGYEPESGDLFRLLRADEITFGSNTAFTGPLLPRQENGLDRIPNFFVDSNSADGGNSDELVLTFLPFAISGEEAFNDIVLRVEENKAIFNQSVFDSIDSDSSEFENLAKSIFRFVGGALIPEKIDDHQNRPADSVGIRGDVQDLLDRERQVLEELGITEGTVFVEASPAFQLFDLSVPENALGITFDLSFFDIGDGDIFTIFINDELVFGLEGEDFTEDDFHTIILDIQPFSGEDILLSMILNSTGDANARIFTTPLQFVVVEQSVSSVPEPGTLALFGLGLGGLAFARRRKKAA